MAKMRENKYLCDMDFTQSDQCFRNKYDVNTNISTLHDCKVMLLLSRGGHLSVYQKLLSEDRLLQRFLYTKILFILYRSGRGKFTVLERVNINQLKDLKV